MVGFGERILKMSSNRIDPKYIDSIDNFIWHENVSFKGNIITFENISFKYEVIISANNCLIYNGKLFKYNDTIPNGNSGKPIQKNHIKFRDCTFNNLNIQSISEEAKKIDIIGGSIVNFKLTDCEIFAKFYINKQDSENNKKISISKLVIKNVVFHENFKLHNANVQILTVEDTDFKKHADFFQSKFEKGTLQQNKNAHIKEGDIAFKAINFKGLALFGDTEFKSKLIFKYVTFESFSHFRKAKLFQGLDLDYSNIQNEMNFFDVQKLDEEKAKNHTSQETYRIIKHNFEKIGNKIEANKYFALELEQKKNNLEKDNKAKTTDYIIFQVNWLSSNFGTNWLRVLCLICITSLLTICFLHIELLKQLFFHPNLFKIEYILKIIYSFFDHFYIFSTINTSKHPVIFLFHRLTLGYLYYQFLISIRKDIRK